MNLEDQLKLGIQLKAKIGLMPGGLVDAYVALCGGYQRSATELNEYLGRGYQRQRVYAWAKGVRPVPGDVQRIMRRKVLAELFGRHGPAIGALLETKR